MPDVKSKETTYKYEGEKSDDVVVKYSSPDESDPKKTKLVGRTKLVL